MILFPFFHDIWNNVSDVRGMASTMASLSTSLMSKNKNQETESVSVYPRYY